MKAEAFLGNRGVILNTLSNGVYGKSFVPRLTVYKFVCQPITEPFGNLTDSLVDHAVYPCLNHGYTLTGKTLVSTTSLFSTSLSKWLEESWHKPVSAETLANIGKWVQAKTVVYTKYSTTDNRIFAYFHRSITSVVRNIYTFSKYATALVEAPKKIQKSVVKYIEKKIKLLALKEESSKTLLSRGWRWIRAGTKHIKKALFFLICKISKPAQKLFKYIPKKNISFQALLKNAKKMPKNIQKRVVHKIQAYIENEENPLKETTIGKIMEVFVQTGLKWGIHTLTKAGIIYGVYQFGKQAVVHYI